MEYYKNKKILIIGNNCKQGNNQKKYYKNIQMEHSGILPEKENINIL